MTGRAWMVSEKDMVGKTIAAVTSICEVMAVRFTDETVVVLEATVSTNGGGGDVYLAVNHAPPIWMQHALRLISDETYTAAQAFEKAARTAECATAERARLRELMRKYPDEKAL